jgi:hypothetical protein
LLHFADWIVQSGGNAVPAMASYPYYGFRTRCRNVTKIPMNIIATVQNYTAGNEETMKQIVANVGPVAAVVSVTSFYQFYKSGIFYDTTCNSNCGYVNHAVIIVGYGTDPVTQLDYWIVKNTWVTYHINLMNLLILIILIKYRVQHGDKKDT